MKISVKLDKKVAPSDKEGRTNVYIWKSLEHLKDYYSDTVSPQKIDNIAEKILTQKLYNRENLFKERDGIGHVLNESCLCNLVEMEILDSTEALETFMKKGIDLNL